MWLDCASQGSKEQGVFVETWRCGALGRTWRTSKRGEERETLTTHNDATDLWEEADAFCKPNRRVVLFAFDLAKQLRISRALVELPALGWHLDKIVMERSAAWALFRDNDRTLMLCDVQSFTPVEFATIAGDVTGFTGEWQGTLMEGDFHLDRCAMRCRIVRSAITQLLRWIEAENLGPFRPTGSGQSYSAFRRRFMSDGLLVHDDMERLEYERVAMWTGRCEAWKHGALTDGPYVEFDMRAAYCQIAADSDIPVRAEGETNTRNVTKLLKHTERYAILAHVTVDTDIPVIPTRVGGRNVWPVGTFSTWLWDPELQLAERYCNSVKVHRAYRYVRAPALRDFARFVLDALGPQDAIYGPIPRRVVKHWSRTLVGRLGLRYRAWSPFGFQPDQDLRLVTYIDADAGTSTDILVAGNDRFILDDMSESSESLPQVPSWVMSECRRRLWDTMMRIGLTNVIYVDTDSIIYRQPMHDEYAHAAFDQGPGMWTLKGTYDRMTINGPRNYFTETGRVISGLPKTARQVAPLEFSGQIMRSIKESMRAGELDSVTTIPRKFVLDAPDLRRQHISGGHTMPFRVSPQTVED